LKGFEAPIPVPETPSAFHPPAHNETLSVIGMRVSNKDCPPLESTTNTQPQLQPALPRLSAIISEYFNLCRAWLISADQLG
jgi:hypothetical protein